MCCNAVLPSLKTLQSPSVSHTVIPSSILYVLGTDESLATEALHPIFVAAVIGLSKVGAARTIEFCMLHTVATRLNIKGQVGL